LIVAMTKALTPVSPCAVEQRCHQREAAHRLLFGHRSGRSSKSFHPPVRDATIHSDRDERKRRFANSTDLDIS
jgi:hypothetical protein